MKNQFSSTGVIAMIESKRAAAPAVGRALLAATILGSFFGHKHFSFRKKPAGIV